MFKFVLKSNCHNYGTPCTDGFKSLIDLIKLIHQYFYKTSDRISLNYLLYGVSSDLNNNNLVMSTGQL